MCLTKIGLVVALEAAHVRNQWLEVRLVIVTCDLTVATRSQFVTLRHVSGCFVDIIFGITIIKKYIYIIYIGNTKLRDP